MSNFVNYADAIALITAIAEKFRSLSLCSFKGSIPFAQLPATPSSSEAGFFWNISDDFTTDARFVEGAGKKYKAGENVGVVDLSTYDAVTPAGNENPTTEGWYELVNGKYVLSTDTTVDSLKTYYKYNPVFKLDCLGQFVDIDAILDIICSEKFDSTKAYVIGDVVRYTDDKLYKFKADHAAGAWDATEVDEKDVVTLIKESEAEGLTQQQIDDLIALLG